MNGRCWRSLNEEEGEKLTKGYHWITIDQPFDIIKDKKRGE
jgi:hypothetical protein